MPACSRLLQLYQEWKNLTQAEGQAISNSDWVRVRNCQQAKQSLQNEIVRLTAAAKEECANADELQSINSQVRSIVNELIELETRNNATLQGQLATVDQERSALDRTTVNLKKVHQRYLPSADSIWNQYS